MLKELERIINLMDLSESPEPAIQFKFILFSLTLSALYALFIAWIYTRTQRERKFSQTFVQSLVMISVIVTAVTAIIGNDLARAFGLVGAVSIIRFRTKVKDPMDTAFLFFTIMVGMANGLRLYILSFCATLFISFLTSLMYRTRFGKVIPKYQKES